MFSVMWCLFQIKASAFCNAIFNNTNCMFLHKIHIYGICLLSRVTYKSDLKSHIETGVVGCRLRTPSV